MHTIRSTVKIVALAAAIFELTALYSCATLQTDIAYEAVPGQDAADLGQLEMELVRLRTSADDKSLASVKARLQELERVPNTDPLYRARLYALQSEAFLLGGARREATKKLSESTAQYPGDEIARLVESRLQETMDKKLMLLDAAIEKSDFSYRLKAEKASVLLDAGKYREALALFDGSLPRLPKEYVALYAPARDKAYALRDADGKVKESSAAYLNAEPLTCLGMVIVAQQETTLLDWFTGGAPWSPGALFERLKGAGWFSDQAARPETICLRKDAALFLWQLLSRGKSEMLKKFSVRYAAGPSSPVPDVSYGSPWFDAALAVAEEGIMDLPDGRNFRPDEIITGLDFYAALVAAVEYK